MYVLLTGCEVDQGTDDDPLEIPAPVLLVPTIPPAISDAVMGALVSVQLRYPSAVTMAESIRAANAAAFIFLGFKWFFRTEAMATGLGIHLTNVDAITDAQAVYGGLGARAAMISRLMCCGR